MAPQAEQPKSNAAPQALQKCCPKEIGEPQLGHLLIPFILLGFLCLSPKQKDYIRLFYHRITKLEIYYGGFGHKKQTGKSLFNTASRSHQYVPREGLEPTPPCGERILSPPRLPFRHLGKKRIEAASGLEPLNRGFADPRLTTWLRRHKTHLERKTRFELATSSLARRHSTAELLPLSNTNHGAEEEI
jgi:hypothetical protein